MIYLLNEVSLFLFNKVVIERNLSWAYFNLRLFSSKERALTTIFFFRAYNSYELQLSAFWPRLAPRSLTILLPSFLNTPKAINTLRAS